MDRCSDRPVPQGAGFFLGGGAPPGLLAIVHAGFKPAPARSEWRTCGPPFPLPIPGADAGRWDAMHKGKILRSLPTAGILDKALERCFRLGPEKDLFHEARG